MKGKLIITAFFMLFAIVGKAQGPYYVSVNGGGDGLSSGSPFTLQQAMTKVRTVNAGMAADIIVKIAPGEYTLNAPLAFSQADSGKNNHYVIYEASDPNNKPVISGGTILDNTNNSWQLLTGSNNIWKVNMPAGSTYPRQIYVNGKKAIRAKSESNVKFYETASGYFSNCMDFTTLTNIKDVEAVGNMRWRSLRLPVASQSCNELQIAPDYWDYVHYANSIPDNLFKHIPAFRIENALQLIDQEKEWYIDRHVSPYVLYYKPENGYTTQAALNGLKITIPKWESLITGTVNNIKFRNLVFSYSTWEKPSKLQAPANNMFGFWAEQGDRFHTVVDGMNTSASQIPGAISLSDSDSVKFQSCSFTNLGATGLTLLQGCKNFDICGNTFTDIAASGICVGNFETTGSLHVVEGNKIQNNTIYHIATEYYATCGIMVAFAKNSGISHNKLYDFPYTGISVGYFGNNTPTVGNTISYNNIDCSNQIIPDGGGIYTLNVLGDETHKTQITDNYIFNQQFYRGAIYLDQTSSYINVDHNLIDTNIASFPSFHECNENSIRSVEVWYASEDVSIQNNFYNQKYQKPYDNGCLENYPCTNIDVGINTPFSPTGNHGQALIITNSGPIDPTNCNN